MGNNFNLITQLVYADFKLKYYGSILGFLWSFLKPLLMLGTIYFVFKFFLQIEFDNFALFLLLGIIIWGYFTDSTIDSMNSVQSKVDILKNTNIKPSTIALVSCTHNFISLILNLIIFLIFFFSAGLRFGWNSLFFFVFLVLLFILTYSISTLTLTLNARFTDFRHIWQVILQLGFWATPIVYSLSNVSVDIQKWFMLNPMARIIVQTREAIIYNIPPSLKQIIISVIIICVIALISWLIYTQQKDLVADNL